MLLCAQYVLPVTSDPLYDAAVLVRDGVIRDMGSADMMKLRYPDEEVVDYGPAAIAPGFVDLHTHLEYTALRGVVHDVPYAEWRTSVHSYDSKMDHADRYNSAILGGLEALSHGITCVADITATGAACSAVQKIGLRSFIYREVAAMDKRRIDYAMTAAAEDVEAWSADVDSDRITVGIAPGGMFVCHPLVMKRAAEFARNEQIPLAMHIAGSREEFMFIKRGSSPFAIHTMDSGRGFVEVPPWLPTGSSPVQYAVNWGAFEADQVLAIHCVHVDDHDVHKLKEYNVSVAACPRCNAQLAMGASPIQEFLRAGLVTGLGTDSPAATDSTDMLVEMRMGMLVQRALNPRGFLDSATMFEMATMGGARALGLEDKIGSLEIGKKADIIAIEMPHQHGRRLADPVGAVVNSTSGADVCMTMVDGKVLYTKDGWSVGVDVDGNIDRVVELRERLKV